MSDYTRIIARLKKSNTEYKESKQKKEFKNVGNSSIQFGAVTMYFSPRQTIVGIYIFDMRVDIENFLEKWRGIQEVSFADMLIC